MTTARCRPALAAPGASPGVVSLPVFAVRYLRAESCCQATLVSARRDDGRGGARTWFTYSGLPARHRRGLYTRTQAAPYPSVRPGLRGTGLPAALHILKRCQRAIRYGGLATSRRPPPRVGLRREGGCAAGCDAIKRGHDRLPVITTRRYRPPSVLPDAPGHGWRGGVRVGGSHPSPGGAARDMSGCLRMIAWRETIVRTSTLLLPSHVTPPLRVPGSAPPSRRCRCIRTSGA